MDFAIFKGSTDVGLYFGRIIDSHCKIISFSVQILLI